METEVKENLTESRSNNNLLRFILIIGISSAVGGIIAGMGVIWGTYLYSIVNYGIIDIIIFSVWGAIGGLSVGVAIKKDKLLLTLLGGIGFGIGTIVSGFLDALSFNVWSSGIGVAGIIFGLFEGIALGFYYRTSKFIGILTICGVVGFGVAGIIGILTYKITLGIVSSIISNDLLSGLIMSIISFMVTGLIGGAALGYSIYYIEKFSSAGGTLG